MTSDVEPRASLVENILAGRVSSRVLAALGIGLGLLIVVPIVVLLLRTGPDHPVDLGNVGPKDDMLDEVRNNLFRETDLITLKNSVQQINSHFNANSDQRPHGLTPAERELLKRDLALSDEELGEIDGGNYSTLDANYLDACFLFRDAGRSIQYHVATVAAEDPAVRLTPLEQATAAFNWVTRQVRLEERSLWRWSVPPYLGLRRGRGTALERALIFLDLLRQMNVDDEQGKPLIGCLVGNGTKANPEGDQSIWAVGVLIDNELYLFDPRLGLPVPGPNGQGVATLAQVLKTDARVPDPLPRLTVGVAGAGALLLHRDGPVLDQLTVGKKYPYDVTADQARVGDAYLYVSLPALAPRMAQLQKLLASRVHVNLSADPVGELAQIKMALDAAGAKPGKVAIHREGLRVLREFLPPEEGGADRKLFGVPLAALPGYAEPGNRDNVGMTRKRFLEYELVPWLGLPDNYQNFPYNVGLGSVIREMYARSFRHSALEPGGARDLILRGHYDRAISDLMEVERKDLTDAYRDLQNAVQAAGGPVAFDRQVQRFLLDTMAPAAADMQRAMANGPEATAAAQADVEKKWFSNRDVNLLLQGSVAARRLPEITYLLALAKQEIAEQFQLRADAVGRRNGSGKSPDDARAKENWVKAEPWWRELAHKYPQGPLAGVARRPRGRCQMMLGDWQAALVGWEDMTDPLPQSQFDRPAALPPSEKVGNLFLAHELRRQHQADKP